MILLTDRDPYSFNFSLHPSLFLEIAVSGYWTSSDFCFSFALVKDSIFFPSPKVTGFLLLFFECIINIQNIILYSYIGLIFMVCCSDSKCRYHNKIESCHVQYV